MYHQFVRAKVLRIFRELNKGNYEPVLSGFGPSFEHWFVGHSTLSGLRTSMGITRAWYERLYRIFPNRVTMQNSSSLPKDVLINVPSDLPVPEDDGACNHLPGSPVPSVELASTSGRLINLASQPGWVVIYCYPMTGRPGRAIPDGWVDIPGAAGCTPQSCSFRDSHDDIKALGARVFGMSVQTTEDQVEASQRLQLPYELLSDSGFLFAQALGLPVFDAGGMQLLKRVTLIARDGRIAKYFYPVFPPDKNANEVLSWLQVHTV